MYIFFDINKQFPYQYGKYAVGQPRDVGLDASIVSWSFVASIMQKVN